MPDQAFDGVVFGAGGSRCLWQGGFWRECGVPEPRWATGVSAGAAMACLAFAGKIEEALADFKIATGANRKNFYPGNVVQRAPLFPHAAMFRLAVLRAVDPDTLAQLQRGPEIGVALARPPRWLGGWAAVPLAVACYAVDSKLRGSIHEHRASRWVGFTGEVVSVRRCADPTALAELLLASACSPPVTPLLFREGRAVIDGAVVDSAPVRAAAGPPGRALVLLSRRHERLPQVPGRVYAQPSAPVPVSKWDYTNPAGLQGAYDLGRRDGEHFRQTSPIEGPRA